MILVTFAVPFESAAFRRRAASRHVRIVHTGVGGDTARVAVECALCEGELPERVISSGFAGALSPDLRVGDTASPAAGLRFATSTGVLATAEAKREFRDRTGADVVDMESDAIREVCGVAGVPFHILRVISDGAADDLALPPEMLENLAQKPLATAPQLIWTLLSDSGKRRTFVRFVRDCRKAQMALADALEHEILGSKAF